MVSALAKDTQKRQLVADGTGYTVDWVQWYLFPVACQETAP